MRRREAMTCPDDGAICCAAIARWSLADASVIRYVVDMPKGKQHELANLDNGEWFAIFIKHDANSAWECGGRRRSLSALLTMIEAA